MSRFMFVTIKRGDEIPRGAVLGGRTSSDGEVFVGRNHGGEVGKLNLKDGRMWNIWCHKGGDTQDGEILLVTEGCPFQWVPVKKGAALPADAALCGHTDADGDLYAGRRDGAVGKLNMDNGKVNNFWFHGDWFGKHDGEVLVVGPIGAGLDWVKQYTDAKGGEARGIGAWIADHKAGLAIAGGIVAAGAAVIGGAAAAGAFKKDDAPAPAAAPAAAAAAGAGYSPAAAPAAPAPHEVAQQVAQDPAAYDADGVCDGPRAGERVDWLVKEKGMSHDEAVKAVMKEFPLVFWWKPMADCDGVKAQERAQWLVENKGMSVADARGQVRNEFPQVFGGSAATAGGDFIDCKFPHTMSTVQEKDGPKLRIAVTPKNPATTSLVAVHYTINGGASMNFETKQKEGDSFVLVTPNGGGYPTCPPGATVEYWLGVIVNGLIEEEPAGAGPHGKRLTWTAH